MNDRFTESNYEHQSTGLLVIGKDVGCDSFEKDAITSYIYVHLLDRLYYYSFVVFPSVAMIPNVLDSSQN